MLLSVLLRTPEAVALSTQELPESQAHPGEGHQQEGGQAERPGQAAPAVEQPRQGQSVAAELGQQQRLVEGAGVPQPEVAGQQRDQQQRRQPAQQLVAEQGDGSYNFV